MHYIMTFVWSFLLVSMLNYVAGSIGGTEFDFMAGVTVSIVLAIFVLVITAIIPNDSPADV
ncbi:YjzD family protein [Sporosarcina sp. GW1-11]|uniref:YjzD family protein n=1 Tax=Sporosarcina sp. GW1-11 TaxID=2899126 RepID=UPI00294F03D1|nr:YjzD family protein [Sporosarcina sp. GW1-11]MDV6376917.1 YjzD family protein [Sporosarcina sp. GW1-11]